MSRRLKDAAVRRAMCKRLRYIAEVQLALQKGDLAKAMGYANSTVLNRVWKGEVFPDTERLLKFSLLSTKEGLFPNIHWIITGRGSELLCEEKSVTEERQELKNLVNALPDIKVASLIALLK